MEVEITAFAPSGEVEHLHTALRRVGCSSHDASADRRPPADGHVDLLYVGRQARGNPGIRDLLERRSVPFDLLLADEHLFDAEDLLGQALDFCRWPVDDVELVARLRRAAHGDGPKPPRQPGLPSREDCLRMNLVGDSPAFVRMLQRIKRLAQVDANVLINGETGTGKELAARALHYLGPRRGHCFQAINCGAIPEGLVENELFGHASGAFTDARQTQVGLIEQSCNGTLFLDEVDMLPAKAQAALLRFIETQSYRPLGGREERKVNTRVIAASNANLEQLAEQGLFRLDLFYRLNLLTIALPPLRQRREDIPLLADHFLGRCEKDYRCGPKILHPYTRAQLAQHGWRGNVRELENFIRREYLLADSAVIVASPDAEADVATDPSLVVESSAVTRFQDAKEQAIRQFECGYLRLLLQQTDGNVTRAAELAGKERRAFGKLAKKHGIDPRSFARGA
jgi:DNA-binding NtrC family response regulator